MAKKRISKHLKMRARITLIFLVWMWITDRKLNDIKRSEIQDCETRLAFWKLLYQALQQSSPNNIIHNRPLSQQSGKRQNLAKHALCFSSQAFENICNLKIFENDRNNLKLIRSSHQLFQSVHIHPERRSRLASYIN